MKIDKIEKFPTFVKISKSHSTQLRRIVQNYPPYSDFNFSSLYSWDIYGQTAISFLYGNLVIKMKDYIKEGDVYSFIGNNKLKATAERLLKITDSLKLIPEVVAKEFFGISGFDVIEDSDNHDYILDLGKLSTYPGAAFKDKRNGNTRGRNLYKKILFEECPFDNIFQKKVNNLLASWISVKKDNYTNYEEFGLPDLSKAINRIFGLKNLDFLRAMRLVVDNKFAGFMICEDLGNNYMVGHYINGDTLNFHNIYEILYNEIGKYFSNLGFNYLNIEQDLGVSYMKKTKSKWVPDHFLKKFKIVSNNVSYAK